MIMTWQYSTPWLQSRNTIPHSTCFNVTFYAVLPSNLNAHEPSIQSIGQSIFHPIVVLLEGKLSKLTYNKTLQFYCPQITGSQSHFLANLKASSHEPSNPRGFIYQVQNTPPHPRSPPSGGIAWRYDNSLPFGYSNTIFSPQQPLRLVICRSSLILSILTFILDKLYHVINSKNGDGGLCCKL